MVDFKNIDREKARKWWEEMDKKHELEKITACFTGHRPQSLFGFDDKHPKVVALKEKLKEVISFLIENEGITRFVSGGALGVDTYAFECVQLLKSKYPQTKNILAIPFAQQDKIWSDQQKRLYARMKEVADEIVYVDTLKEYAISGITEGVYSPAKMQKRNEYMVDSSKAVIAVWNGAKGGTGNCVRYCSNKKDLYRIFPDSLEMEIRYGYLS